MKIAKNISLGIGMQVLVLLMHILIHFIMDVMNSSFDDIRDIQIATYNVSGGSLF